MPPPSTTSTSRRAVIRLLLDVTAKEQLDKLCARRGMTQIAVVSRLVKWFSKQDEMVQASVLGLLSERMLGDPSEALLQQIAEGRPTLHGGSDHGEKS